MDYPGDTDQIGGGAGEHLGGTGECQKEFVESLNVGRKKGEKKPPIANAFALGYTYLDVLDADHEG